MRAPERATHTPGLTREPGVVMKIRREKKKTVSLLGTCKTEKGKRSRGNYLKLLVEQHNPNSTELKGICSLGTVYKFAGLKTFLGTHCKVLGRRGKKARVAESQLPCLLTNSDRADASHDERNQSLVQGIQRSIWGL